MTACHAGEYNIRHSTAMPSLAHLGRKPELSKATHRLYAWKYHCISNTQPMVMCKGTQACGIAHTQFAGRNCGWWMQTQTPPKMQCNTLLWCRWPEPCVEFTKQCPEACRLHYYRQMTQNDHAAEMYDVVHKPLNRISDITSLTRHLLQIMPNTKSQIQIVFFSLQRLCHHRTIKDRVSKAKNVVSKKIMNSVGETNSH